MADVERKASADASTGAANVAEAAQAEVKVTKRHAEWHGHRFDLPPTLPGTIIFDIAGLEQGGREVSSMINILTELVGEDGVQTVKDAVRDEGLSLDKTGEALGELFETVMGVYGTTGGESPASAPSSATGSAQPRPTSNGTTVST